jgi:ABC-type amino acid transport substrate-binding protein
MMASTKLLAATDIVIGVEDVDYPPIFSLEQGNFVGYSRELLDLFARNQGLKIRYEPLPIMRMMKAYEKGAVDCIFPDNPKWKSADKTQFRIHYSASALSFQDAVMVLSKNVGKPMRSLGIILGFQPWKFQDAIDAGNLRIINAPGSVSLIQMVLAGRVDGGNMALQVARFHLKRMGKADALEPDPNLMPLETSNYHLSCIRRPEIVKVFDEFLRVEQNAVKKLQQKFGF